jgi:hypothetical protein
MAKNGIQKEEDSFQQQIGLKLEDETSEILYLEHRFSRC